MDTEDILLEFCSITHVVIYDENSSTERPLTGYNKMVRRVAKSGIVSYVFTDEKDRSITFAYSKMVVDGSVLRCYC